ncbi:MULTISPECIES: hypothetical protein [unclassified Streptomyces]
MSLLDLRRTPGILLGLMMCSDMGGPLNKVAYAFAVAETPGISVAA